MGTNSDEIADNINAALKADILLSSCALGDDDALTHLHDPEPQVMAAMTLFAMIAINELSKHEGQPPGIVQQRIRRYVTDTIVGFRGAGSAGGGSDDDA